MTPRAIRQLRDRLGLDQTEFGKVLGLSGGKFSVSRLENGHTNPSGPLRVLLELLAEEPGLAARQLARRRSA